MIGDALALSLHDLLTGLWYLVLAWVGATVLVVLWIACIYWEDRKRKKQRRAYLRRWRIAHELTVAEKRREAEIRVIGPLPKPNAGSTPAVNSPVRDWDLDHATRTHVGRRG